MMITDIMRPSLCLRDWRESFFGIVFRSRESDSLRGFASDQLVHFRIKPSFQSISKTFKQAIRFGILILFLISRNCRWPFGNQFFLLHEFFHWAFNNIFSYHLEVGCIHRFETISLISVFKILVSYLKDRIINLFMLDSGLLPRFERTSLIHNTRRNMVQLNFSFFIFVFREISHFLLFINVTESDSMTAFILVPRDIFCHFVDRLIYSKNIVLKRTLHPLEYFSLSSDIFWVFNRRLCSNRCLSHVFNSSVPLFVFNCFLILLILYKISYFLIKGLKI